MKDPEEQRQLDLTQEAEETRNRRKLYWLIGLVSTGLFSLAAFVTVVASSLQFFVLTPIETYRSIDEEQYSALNVQQMTFERPEDFYTAEESLRDFIPKSELENNPIPHYLLGSLYETLGRGSEALKHYQAAIRIGTSSWYNQNVFQYFTDDAHGAVAILYYENNKNKEALEALNRIRSIEETGQAELLLSLKDMLEDPQRADFHMTLGRELRQVLKLGKAREEFELAAKLSTDPTLKQQARNLLKTQMPAHVRDLPPLARYYSLAGDAYENNQEDLLQAASFYEQAVEELPRFEMTYNDLAIVYRQLKDYNKAARYAQEAVSLNPNFYNPHLTLGDIELDREQYPAAIRHFNKAKEIISRLPDEDARQIEANIENQLGFAYELMNDTQNALAHYREAIKKAGELDESIDDYDYADAAIKRITETAGRRLPGNRDKISSLP